MKPYAHQQKLLDENPTRRLLAWETGVGKTPALIWMAENNTCPIVLVICPKGIKEQWKKKVAEYGTPKRYLVVTKEEFKRDWKALGCRALIIDESHHFSGMKSAMHKTLIKYLKTNQPRYVWTASATPYRSEPFNVYALGLVHGYAPISWIQFRDRFYRIRYLGKRVIWVKRDDDRLQEELRGYMAPFTSFARLEECFDMPEQIDEEPEGVGLSAEQKKAIMEVEKTETNPLVRVSAIHQIENGGLKGNEFREDTEYACAKDERILELAEEHKKLLVFCRFTAQIERLERIMRENGIEVFVITGANSSEHFNISRKAELSSRSVLIAQISVAAGWEVPSYSIVVYASQSYSLTDFYQSRGRVIRGNKLARHVFLFLHSGEIDKAVYRCIMDKKDFDPMNYYSIEDKRVVV